VKRIAVVVTARPSYSRIRSALAALRSRGDVEVFVIAGASAVVTRYGRIADQIHRDGFLVAEEVSSVVEDDTLANSALSTGLLLSQLAGAFKRLRPDVVVSIADRHETLATAIAASYQHIPLCHIQGGEVTGSIDDRVRNAVTQLADVHCVASNDAAARVNRMRPGAEIHVTGCPSIDLAAEAVRLGPLGTQHMDVMPAVCRDPFVVVLQHPVTSEAAVASAQMEATVSALEGINAVYFWPGEDAGGAAMSKALRLAGVQPVLRNLPPLDFLRLLLASECLVGNSSVGIRECSFLSVPVVNVGSRQEGRQRSVNVIDVDHDPEHIRQAVEQAKRFKGRLHRSVIYGDGHAGERIAAVLASERKREAA
jgi:UDP-hydrolysing UDP-N-acetyl-D-glucosamine 2-epimerase